MMDTDAEALNGRQIHTDPLKLPSAVAMPPSLSSKSLARSRNSRDEF